MLRPVIEHPWDLSPTDAIALQCTLAGQLRFETLPGPIATIAGVDVSVKAGLARAAVVVIAYPSLEPVEEAFAAAPAAYPYVPGLLSFREAPTVLEALGKLRVMPDLLMFDGQGYAHPRRMGIASHMGLVLDRPSIGCAKSRLTGRYDEPAPERGSWTPLMAGDELLGAVVRTRTGVKPVFVSAGHRITLAESIDLVLATARRYRLPEPTRLAHGASVRGEPR